jgi:hypothetical protein
MDAQRFDDAIRALSSQVTRRTLLAGLAALPFIASEGKADAWEPKRRGKNTRKSKKGKKAKKAKNRKHCAGKECGGKCGDCRHGKTCSQGVCICPEGTDLCGEKCVDLFTDPDHCGACDTSSPSGVCRHGSFICDPFNNTCPQDDDGTGQCGCAAAVASSFEAVCVDRNSACDLDKPCFSDDDCPARSVCIRGCSDPPTPPDPNHNPNRCSKPCNYRDRVESRKSNV